MMMNQARIEQLHDAATEILQETGLNVHHPEMRRKLGDTGAKLGEGPRVYIPAEIVEQALSTAKHQEEIVVHNRLGEPVMPLGPHQIYFGTGSDCLNFSPPPSPPKPALSKVEGLGGKKGGAGEHREFTQADIVNGYSLCDSLPDIYFVMSIGISTVLPGASKVPAIARVLG